jgi:type IV fimbrial biogenesis protein FimT
MEVSMEKRQAGLTLIEIVTTLSVLGVLLGLGLPGFKQTFDRVAADQVMKNIISAVALTKQTAIVENTLVTFCRSNDGLHCQGKWNEGSIIFTDGNGDRLLNNDDRLVYRFPALQTAGELTFKSFGNKQYLQITGRGFTNYQSGNFTFCPQDKNPGLARQVVINQSGRTRMARDNDNDGIVENSQGDPLDCS